MADVVDIINRLSLEVTGQAAIQDTIDKFQKQAAAIDVLEKKLANLQLYYKNSDGSNQQKATQAAIDKTTQAIQLQTTVLQRQISANKDVQTAAKNEISLYDKLTDTIRNLNNARKAATDPVIYKTLTGQLNQAKEQLNELNGGNGILAQLLGSANTGAGIGRQILIGSLYGAGIGSGFNIITRITSGLLDYGKTLFDTEKHTKDAIDANEKFEKSFEDLYTSLSKYRDLLKEVQFENSLLALNTNVTDIGNNEAILSDKVPTDADKKAVYDKTLEGLKRTSELTKAKGVVNGEEYNARERDLQKDQDVRAKELQQAQEALADADKYKDLISQITVKRLTSRKEIDKYLESQKGHYNAQTGAYTAGQFSNDDIEKAKSGIGEAIKKSDNVGQAVGQVALAANHNQITAQQAVYDKQKELEKAQTEDVAKTNTERYKLSEELRQRLTKEEQDGAIERNNVREAELNEIILKTTDLLDQESELRKENFKIRLDEENNAVDEQIKLATKNGSLTTTIQKQFDDVKLNNLNKYNNQVELETIANQEKQRDLAIQQADATNTFNANRDKKNLSRTTGQISVGVNEGIIPSFGSERELAQQQNQILLNELNAYYQQQFDLADKAGADTTDLKKKHAQDIILLEEQQYRNELNIYEKYLDDFSKTTNVGEKQLSDKEDTESKDAIEKISERLRKGLSTQTYQYKKSLEELGAFSKKIREDKLPAAEGRLSAAQQNLDEQKNENINVQLNPSSTPQQKTDSAASVGQAQDKVDQLKGAVDDLKIQLNEADDAAAKKRKQRVLDEINAIQEVVDATFAGLAAINEAKQQSLDIEIGIRKQQVDQANVLAERGNVSALKQQQDLLNNEEQQKELAAKREIEINQALIISNSILAIVKAAVLGGPAAPFTIAAAVIALGIGIASVTSLAKKSEGGFAKGGFTGEGSKYDIAGNVHRGEFVFDQDKTRQYRPLFEAMHKGFDPIPMLKPYNETLHSHRMLTDGDIKLLSKKMEENTNAVKANHTEVNAQFNERGIALITTKFQSSEKRRFNA